MARMTALATLLLVVAACAGPVAHPRVRGSGPEKPTAASTTTASETTTTTTTTLPIVTGPLSLPDQVSLTLLDLDEFWSEALPATFDIEYTPVTILGGYDVDRDGSPPCGDEVLDPSIARGNAFYCPADDTVAWDEVELFPTLYDDFGPFAVSLVLAHEWGHAVQARVLDGDLPTIVSELQADCLAGSWAGYALAGGRVDIDVSELDVATAGFLYFRDPVAGAATDPGAHGNAFDRVGAFTDGIRGGAEECSGYVDEYPDITQTGFLSPDDAARGGDLPKSEVFSTLALTLDEWWATRLAENGGVWEGFSDVVTTSVEASPPCSVVDPASIWSGFGYCEAEDALVLDIDGIVDPLYDAFGDFGPALVMGAAWAEKGQVLLGLDTVGRDADLQGDCLMGAWAGDGRPTGPGLPTGGTTPEGNPERISLSPGDLDEAIQSILFLGETVGAESTAFERVEAMRTGVLGGVDACLVP